MGWTEDRHVAPRQVKNPSPAAPRESRGAASSRPPGGERLRDPLHELARRARRGEPSSRGAMLLFVGLPVVIALLFVVSGLVTGLRQRYQHQQQQQQSQHVQPQQAGPLTPNEGATLPAADDGVSPSVERGPSSVQIPTEEGRSTAEPSTP